MSSTALKKPLTFAPRRGAWYGGFFSAKKVRSHVVIAGVLSPVLFAVVLMVSLSVFLAGANILKLQPTVALQIEVPAPMTDPLVASIDTAVHFFHVPGAYVDSSIIVPSLEAPQFVVSKDDVASVAPYFVQSFQETIVADWNQTFGLGGKVFVASVYEFGSDDATVANNELNVEEAWSAYINGLSNILEPYVH